MTFKLIARILSLLCFIMLLLMYLFDKDSTSSTRRMIFMGVLSLYNLILANEP